jgi:hypothetical protein
MGDNPHDGFVSSADDELSDEMLGLVSGGAVIGTPLEP